MSDIIWSPTSDYVERANVTRFMRAHGIGMTDLVKRATARADELTSDEYREGMGRVERLVKWSRRHPAWAGAIGWLIGAEFALAVLSDVLGRVVSLLDSLLSERFSNTTSVRLMEHAATLDLEDFEDSELQDRLDRARRQASSRMTLTSQLFGQAQDIVTIISFAAGLAAYAPWLIPLLLLALVPAFVGEAHFNAQTYALAYSRTPEQRELDYVRQTGASVETAKEVKIFGLNAFLIQRYRQLAEALRVLGL